MGRQGSTASGHLNPEQAFVNAPYEQLYGSSGCGVGQSTSVDALCSAAGVAMQDTTSVGPQTHLLVTTFELGEPFEMLKDLNLPAKSTDPTNPPATADNPLVQLADTGVKVTVVNHYHPEATVEEAAPFAERMGVPSSVVTRIGAHTVREGIVLVHPPMWQHRFENGQWLVRPRRGLDGPPLPHPCVLPPEDRQYGCMHPKLYIVRWASGTVRVAVTSGNVGRGEWGAMAEVGQVQTFRQGGGHTLGGVPVPPPLLPTPAVGGSDAAAEGQFSTLFVTPCSGTFGDVLRAMLLAAQVPPASVAELLAGVDFSEAASELVLAKPGNYRRQHGGPPAAGGAVSSSSSSGGNSGGGCGTKRSAAEAAPADSEGGLLAAGGGVTEGGATGGPLGPVKRARGEIQTSRTPAPNAGVTVSLPSPHALPLFHSLASARSQLDAELLSLSNVFGHVALRAHQRFAVIAVGKLLTSAAPWLYSTSPASGTIPAPLPGGAGGATKASTSQQRCEARERVQARVDGDLRALFPFQGLAMQGSSIGALSPALCRTWLASSNGVDEASLPVEVRTAAPLRVCAADVHSPSHSALSWSRTDARCDQGAVRRPCRALPLRCGIRPAAALAHRRRVAHARLCTALRLRGGPPEHLLERAEPQHGRGGQDAAAVPV